MKLSADFGTARYRITAYSPGEISVNGEVYRTSLLLTPWQLDPTWEWQRPEAFDLSALASVRAIEPEPELILLGTGEAQRFPERDVMVELLRSGIGIEVMDTPGACRTFNVVMAEDRRVVAALLPR